MSNSRSFVQVALIFALLALGISVAMLFFQRQKYQKDLSMLRSSSDSITTAAAKWDRLDNLSKAYMRKRSQTPQNATLRSAPFSDLDAVKLYIAEFIQDTTGCLADLQGGQSPTTSVWVDLETLSNLVEFLIDNNGDGARLYFAKYPELQFHPDPLRKDGGAYDKKYMVIMNSTKLENGNHTSFYEKVKIDEVDIYRGFYNYNETCPPNKCKGSEIRD